MNNKRKTGRKILIFSLIGLVLVGLTVYAVFFRKKDLPLTIQSDKITRRNLIELVTATGRIQPVVYVKISPEVSGEIIDLPVKEGQLVNKGDVLMRIKPDFYQANRNSAEASLNSSLANSRVVRANLEKAEAEFKRAEDLFKNSLVSDSQFLDYKTTLASAKAQLDQSSHQTSMSRASLARAEEDLSKTTIYAPISGTISKLNSQRGERVVGTATYQGTEVMTISDLNDMEARVDIGEIDVVLISIGQKARLEVDSFRDKKFTGFVSEIANTAKSSGAGSQQESTKFEVRIRIQEKESFRPGMSVTAEIETRYRTNALAVPIQSVTTRMPKENKLDPKKTSDKKASPAPEETKAPTSNTNESQTNATQNASGKKSKEGKKPVEVVFLVDNNAAKMTSVKRGISDDSYTEITEGVSEGQEVVSGGYKAINRELEDQKKVKVDNSKQGDTREESKDEKK